MRNFEEKKKNSLLVIKIEFFKNLYLLHLKLILHNFISSNTIVSFYLKYVLEDLKFIKDKSF